MEIKRRSFVKKSLASATGLSLGWTAQSYARILGSNDRINVCVVGF